MKQAGLKLDSCEGKARFRSMGAAAKTAKRGHDGRVSYACRYCSGFHIGTPMKTPGERIKRRVQRAQSIWME